MTIRMTSLGGHRMHNSTTCGCSQEGNCNVCDGGLLICQVCGLFEGCLTTECPGVPSYSKADDIYAGKLDFVAGEWHSEVMSCHCPPYLHWLAEQHQQQE